ncbi:hypothetical protein L7F22_047125 [Adiantum nelumboides]|nr:hypothetical protein [Adiantum nelumboides]
MGILRRNMHEVRMHGNGFEGAVWYEGRFQSIDKNSCKVIIYNLYNEHNTSFAVEETQRETVRPIPPPLRQFNPDFYDEGDAVEVLDRGGWWVGVITKRLEGHKFSVYFRDFGYELDYTADLLRVRQDWSLTTREWVLLDSKFLKYAEN